MYTTDLPVDYKNMKNKNCQVCQLGYSTLRSVNRMIINGHSYVDITRQLSDWHAQGLITRSPSYQSVANHSKKHVSLQNRLVRESIEKHARELNVDIENGIENLLTYRAAIDYTMRRGFMLIAEGKLNPSVKDMLEAAKLMAQFEKEEDGSTSIVELIAQVQRIQEAVKAEVEPEVWTKIVSRLTTNAKEIEGPVIPAEVVEEDEEFNYDPRDPR